MNTIGSGNLDLWPSAIRFCRITERFGWIRGIAMVAMLGTLTACGEPKRIVEALPTPPARLICEQAGTRPAVDPEYVIDWANVLTVPQAKIEHEKFIGVLRTREGVVAGYVLKLESVAFVCHNNMQWRRDYEAGLPAE